MDPSIMLSVVRCGNINNPGKYFYGASLYTSVIPLLSECTNKILYQSTKEYINVQISLTTVEVLQLSFSSRVQVVGMENINITDGFRVFS